MAPGPVPDFFQENDETAQRQQVQWLADHLGLDNSFFSKLLRMEEKDFASWRDEHASLPLDKQECLRDLWRAVLHILSFLGCDEQRARQMLEHIPNIPEYTPPSFAPPWGHSSIKSYLEARGPAAIEDVDRWVTSFRFGDPYRTPLPEAPCLSSQG